MTVLTGAVSSALLIAARSEGASGKGQREGTWPSANMLWAEGSFLVSCGFALLAAQGMISSWLTIVAANSLIVIGWNLFAAGMRAFTGLRPGPPRLHFVVVVSLLGFIFLTFLRPSVTWRIVFVSVFAAIAFGECGILSMRSRRSVPGPMPRVSASVFFALGLFSPLRAVMAFVAPVSSLFDSLANLMTTLSFVVASLSLVAVPISLILLRNAFLRAELGRGEALYRGIVENAGVGIYQSTWDGYSLQMNAAGAALFGYDSPEALFAATGRSSMHIYSDVRDRQRFLEQIAEHGHVEDFLVQSRKADGASFWLSLNATLVHGEGGARILTGTLIDVSARVREEEDLKRSRDEKAARLRELQHRVKNGMSVIASLAALKAGQAADEASREAFENLESQIGALASLYDLLYRSGETMDIRLDEYLGGLIEALRTSHGAAERGIDVRTSLESIDVGLKRAEALGIAAVELVSDSLKHAFPSERRGVLSVSLRREGETGVLEVADDGIGLPPGFTPSSSSGFGMTLVDMLARQLGGELEAGKACEGDSGPGARFAIRFPLLPLEPRPSAQG